MNGALFDGFGAPIGNEAPVAFDGPDGVVVTHAVCQLLMAIEDGPEAAIRCDGGQFTADLTYAVPQAGASISATHMGHLVAVADRYGRIVFLGHSSKAVATAISQVLEFAGGGVT